MNPGEPATIGEPLDRVDGAAKVSGRATYAAEFPAADVAYAWLVMSDIPCGRIARLNAEEAQRAPGVLAVITPENALRLPATERRLTLLQDDQVFYNNQPIAVVVAASLEEAQAAAALVRPDYVAAPAKLDFEAGFPTSYTFSHAGEPGDMSWGDVDAGLKEAEIKIDQLYTTPIQNHNPMEPHATLAQWDGDHVTIHDATQHVTGVQGSIAKIFGIPKHNVHVICLFTGGGFGCKGQMWSHVALAALAAKQVQRPVKLVLDRPQMYGPVGARPRTHQQLTIGATREGRLTAIRHVVHANTSVIEDYLESSAFPARVMYACPNISTMSRIVPMNFGTPTYMRAPGVATGTYAIEVAMDELACAIGMDPLQLRLLNYAEKDPHTGKPFTEKNLRECYTRGAAQFGWAKRSPEPRSMREGRNLIGWGMATETYPGKSLPAVVRIRFQPNGRVEVACGTQEIGNGIYTIMVQVASEVLQMPTGLIDVRLGDTTLPEGPISAGSMTTASVTPAVKSAAEEVKSKLAALAAADGQSAFANAKPEDIVLAGGKLQLRSAPAKTENIQELLRRHGDKPVEAIARAMPQKSAAEAPCHSFGAIFAEVAVDADLGMTQIRRIVAVYDVGRIINRKTAYSQFIGGIVFGVGLAFLEDTRVDWRYGRVLNSNLAEYLVPVNATIEKIEVSALDIPDYRLDSLGARGVGEIGITGTGAALCNAVFHATGRRIRDLPITPEKLL